MKCQKSRFWETIWLGNRGNPVVAVGRFWRPKITFLKIVCFLALLLSNSLYLNSQGIPEPGLVIYGVVTDSSSGARLTSGSLQWTFNDGSKDVEIQTELQDINGQYSYVTQLPFETPFPGSPLSADAFALKPDVTTYARSVKFGSSEPNLVPTELNTFEFSKVDRGRMERMDLQATIAVVDSDNDGLPDDWENQNFGNLSSGPGDDPDGDGLTNQGEYLAGTDPNVANEVHHFLNENSITIHDYDKAAPYPSEINVGNLVGYLDEVKVRLNQINHVVPEDLEIMVISPKGIASVLMAAAGGEYSLINANLSFEDQASENLPDTTQISENVFRPTNYAESNSFPPPAPNSSLQDNLAAFRNIDPNGAWSLFVHDGNANGSGNIAQGWSLEISMTANPSNTPPTLSPISNQIVNKNTSLGPIVITFQDTESSGQQISVNATSSDQSKISDDNIQITSGSDPDHRYLALTPALDATGSVEITVRATDPDGAFTESIFNVEILDGSEVQFLIGNAAGSVGSEVLIPLTIRNFTSIAGFQFTIIWDVQVAELVGVEEIVEVLESNGPAPMLIPSNFGGDIADNVNHGRLTVQWDTGGSLDMADDTQIFALRLQLVGESGVSSSIRIDDETDAQTPVEITRRESGNLSTIDWAQVSGEVAISDHVRFGGTLRFWNEDRPMSGMRVGLTKIDDERETTSDANGYFEFEVNAGGDYLLRPIHTEDPKAANGVTTIDILLIRRHILNPTDEQHRLSSPYAILSSDVNDSQSITTLDILLIRRLILDPILYDYFSAPGQAMWKFVRTGFGFADPLAPWTYDDQRTINPNSANRLQQDFVVVKLGDANGSAGPPTSAAGGSISARAGALGLNSVNAATSGVRLEFGSMNARRGSRIALPLKARSFEGATSLQGSIAWDPSALHYQGVKAAALPEFGKSNLGEQWVDQGRLLFSWDDPLAHGVSLNEGAVLFELLFDLTGEVRSQSEIRFGEDPLESEATVDSRLADLTTIPGRVDIANESHSTPSETGIVEIQWVWDQGFGARFHAEAGRIYHLQATEKLSSGEWKSVKTIVGSGERILLKDEADSIRSRFYRIVEIK